MSRLNMLNGVTNGFGVPQFKKPQCGYNLQYRECKGYSQTKQLGTIG